MKCVLKLSVLFFLFWSLPAWAQLEVQTGQHMGIGYTFYSSVKSENQKRPLVLALHGCKQKAENFLAGTRLLDYAEKHDFHVLSPQQSRMYNWDGCWNFFLKQNHQRNSSSELGTLKRLIDKAIQRQNVDPSRIYVIGLSSGSGMALNLVLCFPELISGGAFFSGAAFAGAPTTLNYDHYLQNGSHLSREELATKAIRCLDDLNPTTLFRKAMIVHGDEDKRISSIHATQVKNQLVDYFAYLNSGREPDVSTVTKAPRGKKLGFTIETSFDSLLKSSVQHYVIHGMEHKLSGGSPNNFYSDPNGPNVTKAALKLFGIL